MPSRTLSISRLSSGSLPKIKLYFKNEAPKSPVNPRKCYVELLPTYVISEIGRQIESLSDILSLSLSSCRMRSLLLPFLYSNVTIKTNRQCKTTLVSFSKRPDITTHIRRLVVCPNKVEWTTPGEEIDESLVADLIARICPHLRSLESFAWEGWEMPHDDLWQALRKSCCLLKGISTTIGEHHLNPACQLFNFSNLKQFSVTVKCRSLEWLAYGPPKIEKMPRRFWEMLIERCPRLEELSLVAIAPAHRMFDVRHVAHGRWPRLRSLTLGDMVLQWNSKDDVSSITDFQMFMKFFAAHHRLRHISLQHAGGSLTFPSSFALPFSALPHLESFGGPLKYLRSLPHPEKLRHLSLTSLHHTMSSFPPTFTALQNFPNLESLSIWTDLSFSGQIYLQDDSESQVFNHFLVACPALRHLEMICFTRPSFRLKEFSKALRHSPNLESFVLTKMYKSSDEDMIISASRIVRENPNIKSFTLKYTQDRWPTLSGGRLKQMGVYRTQYDEGCPTVPVMIHASEWKCKAFGNESGRKYLHVLQQQQQPHSPSAVGLMTKSVNAGCECGSPRSSISSDRSWGGSFSMLRRKSISESSFIMV